MKREPFASLAALRGRHKGRCVILANGPSLQTPEQLARVDCPVIGMNRSYERRASDYHVFIDRTAIKEQLPHVAGKCPVIIRRQEQPIDGTIHVPIEFTMLPRFFDLERGWFVAGAAIAATQLAVHLGFTDLVYCGLDLKRRGDMLHFYGHGRYVDFDPQIAAFAAVFVTFRDHYQGEIRAFNTCQDSAERQFERLDFNQVWRP